MEAIVLLALHLLGDFPLQTDAMAANKFGGGRTHIAHMFTHLALYLVVLVFLYGATAALPAIFLAGTHGAIDLRRWAEPKQGFENYPLWVDQSLHVSAIALTVVWFG